MYALAAGPIASREVRETPKVTVGALLLAAVVVPLVAFSQPRFESVASYERQRQIVEEIQEIEAQDGPHSADLIDPLTVLALSYHEEGDHRLAAVAIDQALQALRANYGLYSLEQVPLIRQSMRNEEARGNVGVAWELESQLLTLARRHPDDLRTVPILRDIGDKRMDLLERYLAGEFPPQIVLGCFHGPSPAAFGSCTSGTRTSVTESLLLEARRNYATAIDIIVRHGLYSSDELRELEIELVRGSFSYGSHGYYIGRQALRRLLGYEVANSSSWLTQVNALVQIADWDLLFSNHEPALDGYKQAYEQLQQHGIAQASIEQIFSPKAPVVLPTFLASPLGSEEAEEAAGHVEVAFGITRYGRSRNIEVLDTTTNATDAIRDRLVSLIKRSRFRPRLTDGEFDDTSQIVVRYYFRE